MPRSRPSSWPSHAGDRRRQCAARGGVDRFAGEANGRARPDRGAGLISVRAVDNVVQRRAALGTLDLHDDLRGERARRNVPGVVRRHRDLGMAHNGLPGGRGSCGKTSSVAPSSAPSSSAAMMSASTCNGPRPALMRNAPPAAPSRLRFRNSERFKIPFVSRVSGNKQIRISVRARKGRDQHCRETSRHREDSSPRGSSLRS